jgi:hypothetical protein
MWGACCWSAHSQEVRAGLRLARPHIQPWFEDFSCPCILGIVVVAQMACVKGFERAQVLGPDALVSSIR